MPVKFEIYMTPLAGVHLVERKPLTDSRGYFERFYCREELSGILGERSIAQINRTVTVQSGTIRGIHFQHAPFAETKYVSCLRGEVFDVAVDLRKNSPTFLHWFSANLSGENHRTMVIPEGVAHGFQTLTDNCEMLYLHSSSYRGEAESAIHYQEPRVAIEWPSKVEDISDRDASHPMLSETFLGIDL